MKAIAILWKCGEHQGKISVLHGTLESGFWSGGKGTFQMENGSFSVSNGSRLEITIQNEQTGYGAHTSIATLETERGSFSFFLRDVNKAYPIFVKANEVVVTEANDPRSYEQITTNILESGQLTDLQKLSAEPEENYVKAAQATKALTCQTWLGLSRDMRIFGVGFRGVSDTEKLWDWVQPRFHGEETPIPENGGRPVRYHYLIGRGIGCEYKVTRRLDQGYLPILHSRIEDGEMLYETTSFVSYENSPFNAKTLRGTHYLVADVNGKGHMLTPEQQKKVEQLLPGELGLDEETVYYSRTTVINTSKVPRYAWFKNLMPNASGHAQSALDYHYDGTRGFGVYGSGRVFSITKLNGAPLPQEENAVLVPPGGKIVIEFALPHRPISQERALALSQQDFNRRLQECREFWQTKLQEAAQIQLPEERVDEMMKAGLMHLDLVAYGLEPGGAVVPTIGVYTAIGSESAPIIQFMDSMGWHETARRSLMYFLEKQHDDGFIQNFGGYMLETGAALWSIGEHFRYTKDKEWIISIRSHLEKAYDYLLKWRERNLKEELKGKGYGMLDGKTADPEDPFRSYMLNGYAYLGIHRLAEVYQEIDPDLAMQMEQTAEELKIDIRTSFKETIGNSPVIPLGDGSWVPTCAPWANYRGPLSLYAEGGNWLTHGAASARDSLLGPLYLVLQEVLSPSEKETDYLLAFHNELMTIRNVAFSQPYYSIHPRIHLLRGEAAPFLKAFYNGFAGLADRETYTFWEHYWHASPHKTHEEGWFLMQCRWMLYMEQGSTMRLLPGVPRDWLGHGNTIELNEAASYFGHFSMRIESQLEVGKVIAEYEFQEARKPKELELRIPHPEGLRACRVTHGVYDADRETVVLTDFESKGKIEILY